MRNRLVAMAVIVALVATGLVAAPAGAVAPVLVTRVDSSVTVTPGSDGRAAISYCPTSNPCAFASPPAAVVVTGRYPIDGTPATSPLPANLVAYNPTTTGFTLRAINPAGGVITTAIQVWYHAASTLTANEEVRTVAVTTNANGDATVSYASPRGGLVPGAVVASGVSPDGGTPNIPGSLVVSARTATGFTVRAINPAGGAIVSSSITLSYYAAWAARIDPGTGWVAANATTAVTTDANGYATVAFDQALPRIPTGIVAVGVAPATGTNIAASLIADSPSSGGFRVRVLNQVGGVVASQNVTLSYHAVAGIRSVPVAPLTLLPPTLVRSNGARLQWRRGGGATFGGYEVHRSTTAGFTPSAATLLATLGDGTASSWQDTTAAASTAATTRTYYYKLVADGQASNEVAATTPLDGQATLTLRPGGREGKATYVAADRTSPAGCYDSYNYGSAEHLRIGTATNGVVHRPLLWFDLRDLPSGLSVSAATLSLWSRTSVPALPIRAHRVTRAWQEGRADYPGVCDGSGANWRETQGGVAWSAAGGDVDATADASPTLTAHGPAAVANVADNIDLLGLVRKWASGTPNHGVLLRLADESIPASDKYFDWFSDDADNPALRPSLTITFRDNSHSTGPRVALAAPGAGATVRGAPVRLAATAVDDRRVANVQFLVDGAVVGSDTTAGIPGGLAGKVAQITASGENQPAGEVKENLNDGDAATKWLAFSPTGWVGYQLSAPLAVVRYGLTSANDFPERDPRDWQLQGSQNGQSWTTLDARSGEVFSARFQRKEYQFTNPTGYRYWRLNVTRNNGGTMIQLADWELSDGDASATGSYGLGWNSRSVGDGQRTIVARATDDVGNTSDSAAVQVTVDNTAAPTVSLTGPAAGTTVGSTVTVSASASVGSVVDFLVDGSRFATDTSAPYQATWDTLAPLATAYDGSHTLTAQATSPTGQSTTSAPVAVTVANRTGMYKASFDLNAAGTADDAAAIPPVVVGNELAPPLEATPGAPGTGDLSSTPSDSTQTYAAASSTTSSSVSTNAFQVDVTVTNNSSVAWNGPDLELWYEWYTPQGVVLFQGPGNEHFPTVQPNGSKLIPVTVQPPAVPLGADMAQLRLRFDIYNAPVIGPREWFAAAGNQPVDNPIIVVKRLDGALGLERYWQYEGEDVGAGMSTLTNLANGNMLLRWTPFSDPGRGLATMVDLTYNSLEDHSESPAGNNFSLSVSGLSRLGNPIDIHPNKADDKSGKSNKYVVVTDGDGTTHRFTDGVTGGDGITRFTEPAGVNLCLRSVPGNPAARRWALTRPDKVTFFYDTDGFPTAVVDRNGNTLTFTLQDTPPGEDPGGPKKRITQVTDAGGRSFEIDYWSKDEAQKAHVRGKIQRITDHDGSALDFDYYDDGNLLRLTQRGGATAAGDFLADRSWVFTYTTSAGDGQATDTANQSTRIYSVRDPRGNQTTFDYYGPSEGAQLRWKLQARTNRNNQRTTFGYDLVNRVTTVTAPLSRVTRYTYDTDGKVTAITNPLQQTTQTQWTPDFKVSRVTEPTLKFTSYTYNPNGYLTSQANQLGQTTQLTYTDSGVDPGDTARHLSLLATVTSPRGVATPAVPDDYQWSFSYDAAGNPDRVTDPTSAVADYDFNPPGDPDAGTLAALTTPRGVATPAVPDDYRWSFAYDPSGQPTQITDPLGKLTKLGYDLDGRLHYLQDPNHQSGTGDDVRAYRGYLDYDAFGRLGRQSAPKSTATERGRLIWSGVDFDPNDNVVRRLDPHYGGAVDPETGPSATASYDQMDRPLVVSDSDRSVDPLGERTGYLYDQAGRLQKVTSPKGVLSATTDDYTTRLEYDGLDRVIRQTQYGTDVTDKRITHLCYDLAGDLRSVTTPRAALDTLSCPAAAGTGFTSRLDYDDAHRLVAQRDPLGHENRTSYDPNGNVEAVERDIDTTPDPDRVQKTTFRYDMRDQPIEVRQRLTPTRETVTRIEYDPNGNQSRLISPRAYDAAGGSGNYVNYVTQYAYDQLDRLVTTTLPFGPADGSERQYLHNAYDPAGNLAWTSLPVTSATAGAVQDTAKTKLDYFDPGWTRTSDDPANPAVHFDYTAQGWQAERTPERKDAPGELDETLRMRWAYDPDGQLAERRDQGGQPATYDYDVNNNLTNALDAAGVVDPDEKAVATHADYTGFDEVKKVRHRKQGQTNWTFTDYTSDLNGNTTVRRENGTESDSGTPVTPPREQRLVYDQADWLREQQDLGTDGTSSCAGDQRIVTAFWDSGWERQRDLYRAASGCATDPRTWPKKQTTTWEQFDNGKLKTLKTVAVSGGTDAVTEQHQVGYLDDDGIYLNGNRTSDQFVLKRTQTDPNNHATTCLSAASPCLATYAYDARDRLIRHQQREGKVETFTLDEEAKLLGDTTIRAGSVTTQTKNGQTSGQWYRAGQLTQTRIGVTTANYWYDTLGNLDCVTLAPNGSQADCSPSEGATTSNPNLVADYAYDYLNRLASVRQYNGGGTRTDKADYSYDALDRTTKEVEDHADNGKDRTSVFTYQGLTNLVTQEAQTGAVNKTKTYSYDVYGHRISLEDKNNTTGAPADLYTYGNDVHGSVSQLITDAGQVKASYGYDAYGGADATPANDPEALTAGDTDTQAPLNPYRYSGRRLDSGLATSATSPAGYDMGARRYGPDTGSFLQADIYYDALADLGLSTDPLTQNRYALAGGNPISYVETDGHIAIPDGGGGSSTTSTPPPPPPPTPPASPPPSYPPNFIPSELNDPSKHTRRERYLWIKDRLNDILMTSRGVLTDEQRRYYEQALAAFNAEFPDSGADMQGQFPSVLDVIGITDVKNCVHGSASGCGWTALNFTPVRWFKFGAKFIKDSIKASRAAETAARTPRVIRVGELKLPGVPKGATGVPAKTGKGLQYAIPPGTPELNSRVTGIRVMDPVTSGQYQYPNGYVSYLNKSGQVVNPLTGETLVEKSDPLWHIPLP